MKKVLSIVIPSYKENKTILQKLARIKPGFQNLNDS